MIEKKLQEIEQRLGMEFVQFSINFPKQYKDLIRLIAEVRRLKERNAQITQNYNKRVEKYYYLQQEVRRQRNILIQLAGEESLHQDGMYKTEMQKLHETNKRYKQALEEIVVYSAEPKGNEYDAFLDVVTKLQEIANKALEVDTNE